MKLYIYKFLHKITAEHNPSMMFDLKKYYPDIFDKMQQARRKIILEGMIYNMKKGQKEGYFIPDFNVEIIAKLHVFRIENMVESDLFTKEDFISGKLFKEVFMYHLRSIATEKGLKRFEQKFNELKLDLL